LARPETGQAFFATLANFGRQRPRYPASPAAKPRKVKDYSERARKPQPTDYAGWLMLLGRIASAREPEHLLLTRPCDRCIEEAGDTDSAWPRAAMPSIVAVPVPISDSHCRSRDELDPGIGADRTGYVGLSRCREDKEVLIPVVPPASGTAVPMRRRREKNPSSAPRMAHLRHRCAAEIRRIVRRRGGDSFHTQPRC
jgi:hypothetical protein